MLLVQALESPCPEEHERSLISLRTNTKVVCVAELSTVQAHTQLRNGLSPSCSFSQLRQGFWPRPPTPPQPTQLCRRRGVCSLFFAHHHPPVTCSPGSPRHTAMRWLEAEKLPSLRNQKSHHQAPVSHQREPLSREPGPILSDPRRAGEGGGQGCSGETFAGWAEPTWTENQRA